MKLIRIEAIYWVVSNNGATVIIRREKWINPNYIISIRPYTDDNNDPPRTHILMDGRFENFTVDGTPERFATLVNFGR